MLYTVTPIPMATLGPATLCRTMNAIVPAVILLGEDPEAGNVIKGIEEIAKQGITTVALRALVVEL